MVDLQYCVSGVLQSDSVIHTHTHTHPHIYTHIYITECVYIIFRCFSIIVYKIEYNSLSSAVEPCGLSAFVVDQWLSCVFFAASWTAAHQASLSFTISWSLLKLMSVELVMLSNHLVLCFPLLLLPSVFPSIRIFSSDSALHIRWPKNWSFSISPSSEYSGLIFLRIDWLDPLAVPGTLKNLIQYHSLKVSVLQCSAFFMV